VWLSVDGAGRGYHEERAALAEVGEAAEVAQIDSVPVHDRRQRLAIDGRREQVHKLLGLSNAQKKKKKKTRVSTSRRAKGEE
jgi:hypothetical protein